MSLSEKLSAAQETAGHAMKAVAEQASNNLPAVAGTAVKAAAPVIATAVPVLETISTSEGGKNIGKAALNVADYLIDDYSRTFTGGVSVYRYTKGAILAASGALSETGKEKDEESGKEKDEE